MERFYKLNKTNTAGRDSLLLIDNGNFKTPHVITIDTLNTALQFNTVDIANFIDDDSLVLDPITLKLKINQDVIHHSVTRISFIDQNIIPNKPPNTAPVDTALHLATDKNFLYIWIEESNRWKRVPLSEF